MPQTATEVHGRQPGEIMSEPQYLQGACVWKGADIARDDRWIKQFPAAVLEQIDTAVERSKGIDWRDVDRDSFPLPGAAAFFDDVREELENGSGMVKMRGQIGRAHV